MEKERLKRTITKPVQTVTNVRVTLRASKLIVVLLSYTSIIKQFFQKIMVGKWLKMVKEWINSLCPCSIKLLS